MSDDKNEVDASDWLSSQFNPTEQVPQQSPAPTNEPAPANTQFPAAPVAPSASAPAAQPTAPAPAPPAGSDSAFDWLLQQGAASAPQPAAPVASVPSAPAAPAPAAPAFVPPPLVQPATEPVGEPTRPLSWDEFAATQQPLNPAPTPTFVDEPTQAFTVPPWEPTAPPPVYPAGPVEPAPAHEQLSEPTSALDSLFGDHQFQAYEEVGVLAAVQSGSSENVAPRPPRAPLSSTQKTLMGVAGGLIAVLVLIAMYFLGQHIGSSEAAAAAAAAKSTGSTKAPKSAGTGGPAAAGVQPWTALQGGECLNPFTSAWAATFTVVPCSSDHVAEMVFKGTLPDASGTAYPTTTQLQTEITGLCSAPTAINYSLAKSITDLQVSFTYPATASKWQSDDRTYYCFVDRQSGGNIQGDLSVPTSGN